MFNLSDPQLIAVPPGYRAKFMLIDESGKEITLLDIYSTHFAIDDGNETNEKGITWMVSLAANCFVRTRPSIKTVEQAS